MYNHNVVMLMSL